MSLASSNLHNLDLDSLAMIADLIFVNKICTGVNPSLGSKAVFSSQQLH